ncbi:unnamed protein product [Peniophora sp. CBMAI 1063]|nr:unnamed protein product [Peniophora sp. CBMAI 1063]
MIPVTCNAVGDILTLATLVLDIARALGESRGSASEYRSFTAELHSLHIVLASVARVAERATDPLLRDQIMGEVNRCGCDVRRSLERVAKFSILSREGTEEDVIRLKLKRQWYKLEWRFGHRAHMQSVRTELVEATQRLAAYLSILNVDAIDDLRTSLVHHFNDSVARLCTSFLKEYAFTTVSNTSRFPTEGTGSTDSVNGSMAAAAAVLCVAICTANDVPRAVHTALLLAAVCILGRRGMTHSVPCAITYAQSNSITLHDAVGRRLVLPLELCETFDLFHATIVNLFSTDMKGHWLIDSKSYRIFDANGDYNMSLDWLPASEGKTHVNPGAELEMAVVVRRIKTECNRTAYCCPCCFATVNGQQNTRTSICSSCTAALSNHTIYLLDGPYGARRTDQSDLMKIITDDRGRFPNSRSMRMIPSICSGPHVFRRDSRSNAVPSSTTSTSDHPNPDTSNDMDALVAGVQDFKRIHIVNFAYSASSSPTNAGFSGIAGSQLHIAAANGHYALVETILTAGGIAVDARDQGGHTALHLASFSGHAYIISLLLDYGAFIDACTAQYDLTPLSCALINYEHEAAALLLRRGAIIDAPKSARTVAAYTAVRANEAGLLQMLLRLGTYTNARLFDDLETMTHAAVRAESTELLEILLHHSVGVNVRSKHGERPICLAALHGLEAHFHLLFEHPGRLEDDFSPSAANGGRSLLHYAAMGASVDIMKTLIDHGAGIDARSFYDETPLSLTLSCHFDRSSAVELLLSRGSNANLSASPMVPGGPLEPGRWMPLHIAAHTGAYGCIEALLRHGADVNALTEAGHTPLSLARGKKREGYRWPYEDVIALLLSWGATPET